MFSPSTSIVRMMLNVYRGVLIYTATDRNVYWSLICNEMANYNASNYSCVTSHTLHVKNQSCIQFKPMFTYCNYIRRVVYAHNHWTVSTVRAHQWQSAVYLTSTRYILFSWILSWKAITTNMSLGGLFPNIIPPFPQFINNENVQFASKTVEIFKKYIEKQGIFIIF